MVSVCIGKLVLMQAYIRPLSKKQLLEIIFMYRKYLSTFLISEEEKPPTKPVRVKKPMKRIGSDTGHSTAGKRKALAKSAGQQKTTKQAMKKQQKQKKAKLHTQNI